MVDKNKKKEEEIVEVVDPNTGVVSQYRKKDLEDEIKRLEELKKKAGM
jgi:hypothetical protein